MGLKISRAPNKETKSDVAEEVRFRMSAHERASFAFVN